jgi:hypothetical protein
MSVAVEGAGRRLLICKGAVEEVLSVCGRGRAGSQMFELDPSYWTQLRTTVDGLNADGFRVIAVAGKELPMEQLTCGLADERDLTLLGYIAFLDPPKESAAPAIAALSGLGVQVKVLTGDNEISERQLAGGSRQVHQIGNGARIKLFHHPRTMDLDCPLTDAQTEGDDLVGVAAGDPVHHLAFSRTEGIQAPQGDLAGLRPCAARRVCLESALNTVEQFLVAKGLLHEIECAAAHRFDGHRNICVSRHEYDRDCRAARIELALQVRATQAGHANIQQQTARLRIPVGREELLGGFACRRRVAGRLQQQAE